MTVKASGIVAARQRLADLAKGLREAASGAVVERAAQKIGSQITASAKRILSKHVDSGAAHASALALPAGSTVALDVAGYLKYHTWWPFRSGMPPFVLSNAIKVYKAELEAALSGNPSPLALADAAAEESAAAKAAAKFKRDIARIYRQSDEYKAKKKAEAKRRREDKALDRRIAEREAAEDRAR